MLLALTAPLAQAQDQGPPTRIVSIGQGSVMAMPDGASLAVSVQTRSRRATEAAEENATRMQRVLEALRSAGFGDALATTGYSLRPNYDRNTGIEAYDATNGVRVQLQDVGRAGEIIDLAIGAGANRIGSISFSTSEQNDARHEALAMAVARAREDAEVMAVAAGGRLGALLEVTTDWSYNRNNNEYAEAITVQRYAPIEPGARPVSVKVRTTWLMSSGR
jgi:uncharacterized protein YggE